LKVGSVELITQKKRALRNVKPSDMI